MDAALDRRLAALRQRLIEVVFVSFALGLVVCPGLALSWTRPIGILARMAERVGSGHWDIDLGRVGEGLFFAVAEEGLDIEVRGAAVMVGGATKEHRRQDEENNVPAHNC